MSSEMLFKSFSEHEEEMGIGISPRVLLVGGMSAQEILIGTLILRWYLQNRIVITKIYQVVKYQQKRCFKGLAQNVTRDTSPDLNIMAETKDTGTLAMGRYVWQKLARKRGLL